MKKIIAAVALSAALSAAPLAAFSEDQRVTSHKELPDGYAETFDVGTGGSCYQEVHRSDKPGVATTFIACTDGSRAAGTYTVLPDGNLYFSVTTNTGEKISKVLTPSDK